MAGTNLPRVPEGLRDLMKAYTKEVLREKPTNLYEFSSDYFERIAADRMPQKVQKYEPPQSYEIIMKNRIRQQVPISLVFNIIPDNLTDLIKKFIKAVLREKPDNLLSFAVEYFQRLRNAHSPRMEYTKYSAYEKFVDEKGSAALVSKEKCTCGRILNAKADEVESEKKEQSTVTHSVQYLSAVCIIQKYMRKYLKEKREKSIKKSVSTVSTDRCSSEAYMNAIFIIQRQFRRYLAKKRVEKVKEKSESKENRYDSVEYMNAIRIIQRYCRRYLRNRRTTKARPLNSHKTPSTDSMLSLTTAAFIIQRAFRNMVKTRRAKRHINAELDQGDEVNDNASEAASYTSASTALLSTESTCEHAEFGGVNYEEGVHQQTIQEDEEVENDNTNNLQNAYKTEAIKSKGKSISSDGNELTLDEINDEMNKRKEKRFYAQKSRRDIHHDSSIDKEMATRANSMDSPREKVNKSYSSTENIIKNIMRADSLTSAEGQPKASGKKSISHTESIEVVPKTQKTDSIEPSETVSAVAKAENEEKSTTALDGEDDKVIDNNLEQSGGESLSPIDSLNTVAQSHSADSADSVISNQLQSSDDINKSTPQVESSEEAALPNKTADSVTSTQSADLSNIEESKEKKSSSQDENLQAAAPAQDNPESEASTQPSREEATEKSIERSISLAKSLEIAAGPTEAGKNIINPEQSVEKSSLDDEVAEKTVLSGEVSIATEEVVDEDEGKLTKSINKSSFKADSIEIAAPKPESVEHSETSTSVNEKKDTEVSTQRNASQTKSLETNSSSDKLATFESKEDNNESPIEKPIEKTISQSQSLETVPKSDKYESAPQSQKTSVEDVIDKDENALSNQIDSPIQSVDEQQATSDKLSQSSDKNKSTESELTDKDSDLVEVATANLSTEKPASADEKSKKSSSTESTESNKAADALLVDNAEIAGSPHSENDYSVEVNSLQSVLNTMKEKYNQDESILSGKTSPTEESTQLQTAADPNLESTTTIEKKQEHESTKQSTAEAESVETKSIISTAESLGENDDTKPDVANTKDNYQNEDTLSDIGKSIIIHSVLPGEDDYVLPLSSDATLPSETINNTTENAPDNTEKIENNKSVDKSNEDEEQSKLKTGENQESLSEASTNNRSIDKVEEPIINETIKKIDSQQLESPPSGSANISKEESIDSSVKEKKILNQETGETELDDGSSNSKTKIPSKQSSDSIQKLVDPSENMVTTLNEVSIATEEVVDENEGKLTKSINKSSSQSDGTEIAAPKPALTDDCELLDRTKCSVENINENIKQVPQEASSDKSEIIRRSESLNSKGSLSEIQGSADAVIESIDKSSENKSFEAKEEDMSVTKNIVEESIPKEESMEERKVLQQAKSIPKISVELSMDENDEIENAESTVDVNKDTIVSADLTQDIIKNTDEDTNDTKTKLANESSNKKVNETEDASQPTLSEEPSQISLDNIKSAQSEDNVKTPSEEDGKLSSTSSGGVKPTIKSALSEEAEEKIKEIIQLTLLEEAERKAKDSAEIKASQEAAESKVQDTKSSSSDDKITTKPAKDSSKIVLSEDIATNPDIDISSDEKLKRKASEEVQEKIDDNIKTTEVAEKPLLTPSDVTTEDDLTAKEDKQISLESTKSKSIGSEESNPSKELESQIIAGDVKSQTFVKETQLSTEDSKANKSLEEPQTNTDDSKAKVSIEEPQISTEDSKAQKPIDPSQEEDKIVLSKDAMESEDKKTQGAVELADEKAQPNKANEVKSETQNSEQNKSSLHLSHQSIDTQNKKMPIVKDKHLTSSSSSGRLTNAPVAELQLKSFKTAPDAGNWYDVHNEPLEDIQASGNSAKDITRSDDIYVDNARQLRSPSVDVSERRPNYVFGEPPTSPEAVKPKQSVAFFISFDGDDGKATFKIPKRFLKQDESSNKIDKKQPKQDDEEELSMEPVITAEDFIESDSDIGYQQYGMQKLQTIHELNENESSNELRSLLDKPNENEHDEEDITILEPEVKIIKENLEEVNDELVKQVQNKVENSLKVNGVDADENKYENKADESHENKLKASAQIIQRAFKNYLARRENVTKQSSVTDKENEKLLRQTETKLDENLAATRIQKAIRQFLSRIALKTKETTSTKDRKYTGDEILAAIRIQTMFRNYMRRKKLAYNDDVSKGTSATSLITIIPNTHDSHTPEISINDGELSDDMSNSNSEVNSSKPEWFVGSQRISVEPSERSVSKRSESSETGTIGITEITDNTHLDTDIGNIVNDLNASEVFAQDNGASNNSAGSTRDRELVEALAIAAFGALDATSAVGVSNRQILSDFLIKEVEFSSILEPYRSGLEEVHEEKCIKKTVSRDNLLDDDEIKEDAANQKFDAQLDSLAPDTMDEATSKLMKPDEVIEKMSQRRSSETRDKLKDDFLLTEPVFGEPIIHSMNMLQEQSSLDIEDGDIIVYNRLQRDETRESSAQSESVVFGNDIDDDKEFNTDAETARTQLSRHYTIAGDDPRAMFRSVTIDETVRYIEDDGRGMDNSMSFCLDDETSENIRKKMMAYSLSEGDSDYYDPNKVMPDDFHIDTAMTDAMDTSTETESTIVSAATKIQAGARGFLARRRLRRASAGTKSSTQDTKASFGNDAISESLERFIEEEAAKKIQVAYRLHSKKQKKQTNNVKSASLESSLAAKRQTLQRGDALRNDSNSTPEDENSSSTSAAQLSKDAESKSSKNSKDTDTKSSKDSEEAEAKSTRGSKEAETKSSRVSATRSKRSTDLTLHWPAVRQNSMPVQIDCEVLRPIPKHMRRRIKSAENNKKKNRK
ncbi:microtubule-associated protein 1B [Drosophila nasuta]|uniref:microtubule-associated protein 1B n=1 Tax=Drosophila nasuta TaxID=42062 RepID=UPI00295E2BE2|nr:microtubule-associated protein 1B [Drosophila nasuta]